MSWALNHQGDVARDQGDSAAARQLYEQSLAKFRELGDPWGIAGSLADLGNLAREQKDFRVADSLYRESLGVFQKLEHKRGIARVVEAFAVRQPRNRRPSARSAWPALRRRCGKPSAHRLRRGNSRNWNAVWSRHGAGLTITAGRTTWLEGWVMPVEKAIEEVLRSASPS